MISWIDDLLNRITMYRLVLYYLCVLVAAAAVFGAFGVLPYNPVALAFSLAVLICVSLATNELFARLFKAQPNVESAYITALILALIITPVMPTSLGHISFLIWAAGLAMASKYILAIRKKHIFNPAAVAVLITAFVFQQYASWWIGGNIPMLAFVLVGGLLVVRKLRRFDLVLPFFAAALLACIAVNPSLDAWSVIEKAVLHTSLLFFAFVMLTEPLTTPPTRTRRMLYGAFVGLLFPPQLHLGPLYSTPELALIIGNIFSYLLSPKAKHVLTLKGKEEAGMNLYDFAFAPDGPMKFSPGQYMEFTLAHQKSDSRGNRRYFTIASSPTEPDVHLGVRFSDPSSSFKKDMLALQPGRQIVAGQLSGDFTLPSDPNRKLVLIAGGIGITPFRSMVKFLMDRDEKRDIVLLYSNRSENEIAYRKLFDEAAGKIGLKTVYAITDSTQPAQPPLHSGRIDGTLVQKEVPDYRERTFYISGPHAMVTAFSKTLRDLGVPRHQIKTDFFPGF